MENMYINTYNATDTTIYIIILGTFVVNGEWVCLPLTVTCYS